jgi:hypothetical protein
MNKITMLLVSLALAGSVQAQEVLDYQGAPYTSTHVVLHPNAEGFNVTVPTYSLGQAISGSITLASSLAPNMNDGAVIPTSLLFTDGNLVTVGMGGPFQLTNAPGTSGSPDVFHFWTNASGQITNWNFSLYAFTPGTNSPEVVTIASTPSGDQATFTQFSNSGAFGTASASNSEAGAWTPVSSVGVPEINGASAGSALTLLLGCLAVAWGGRRLQGER